ncbi:hypothetical protein Cgig2_007787 [Carnegiea gigantea]|uniref:Uncharacterized protein n=1 Tax=Carnegiea gigantea TaxID=171969 RepID=A0A9Q1GVQ2_9CARY|nr:hypothetical protein Cgig2_007787 [Carnegiea gigantea]
MSPALNLLSNNLQVKPPLCSEGASWQLHAALTLSQMIALCVLCYYSVWHFAVYGPSTLPCLGVSGRAVGTSPCPQSQRRTLHMSVTSPKCYLRHKSFVYKAHFGGQGRDSDFSRQNRHGFSRSWARLNEKRGDSNDLGESEFLSAKNERLPSLSNSKKHHGITAPRARKREIEERLRKVDELFRKVEAQLGGGAAVKGEKRSEAGKEQNKEIEKSDSFLQLLEEKLAVEREKRRAEKAEAYRVRQETVQAIFQYRTYQIPVNTALYYQIPSESDEKSGETHSEPDLGTEAESDSELDMDLNSGRELDQEVDEEEELEAAVQSETDPVNVRTAEFSAAEEDNVDEREAEK